MTMTTHDETPEPTDTEADDPLMTWFENLNQHEARMKMALRGNPDTPKLAKELLGLVGMVRGLGQNVASLRQGTEEAVAEIWEEIEPEGSRLTDEDAQKLKALAEGAVVLIEALRPGQTDAKVIAMCDEYDKLAKECLEIIEAATGNDEDEDEAPDGEPEEADDKAVS